MRDERTVPHIISDMKNLACSVERTSSVAIHIMLNTLSVKLTR